MMEWADSALLTALQFLAPGFVAAWALFALTADRKLTDFQRVVQALIFSAFIKLFVEVLSSLFGALSSVVTFGEWSAKLEFSYSVLSGLAFGILLAWLLRTDKLYKLLRKAKITTQTSRPSVWYSCFCDNPETYIVLQLRDDRRIQGWPSEWPSIPGEGHVKLVQAVWLDVDEEDDGTAKQKERPLPEGDFIMIDASLIKWVEFQPKPVQIPIKRNEGKSLDEKPAASKVAAA